MMLGVMDLPELAKPASPAERLTTTARGVTAEGMSRTVPPPPRIPR